MLLLGFHWEFKWKYPNEINSQMKSRELLYHSKCERGHTFKSMSTTGPGRGDTCHLTDCSETWPDRLKDIPNNSRSQNGIAIAVFRVELHHPPIFFYTTLHYTTLNKGKSRGLLYMTNSSNSIVATHKYKYVLHELHTGVSCNLITGTVQELRILSF